MTDLCCDLHIHSCLSPCGHEDMTPHSIAGMGALNRLDAMALTDHNTAKNCPAFFKAARAYGVVPIAGTELTTAEDIHVVGRFGRLEGALRFEAYLSDHRVKIRNRPEIFGEQLVMDETDEVIGEDEFVLSYATDIPIDAVAGTVRAYGGIAYPAHVDREANGAIAVLGDFPADCGFTAVEFRDRENIAAYEARYPALRGLVKVVSSDAHVLWHIRERKDAFRIRIEPQKDEDGVRRALFAYLAGETS